MTQTFHLQLATDTLLIDAAQLGLSPKQLQHISVEVQADIIQQPKPCLWLTYYIQLAYASLAAQLNWPTWQQAHVSFTDYLWEQTCLECFIGKFTNDSSIDLSNCKQSAEYIEINVSPSGRYALYKFDDYRSPATLPPTPLLQANYNRAYIDWGNNLSNLAFDNVPAFKLSLVHPAPIINTTITNTNWSTLIFVPRYRYKRSFSIPLDQLACDLFINDSSSFNKKALSLTNPINPCVILYFNNTALYFAPQHASPPDFHDQRYWSAFKDSKTIDS